MKNNVILDKSYKFAIRIIRLYLYLKKEKKEFELSKQIVRSGTSVSANVEESIRGLSRKDFTAKMGIAYKEARETKLWPRLLHDTDFISEAMFSSLLTDCEELIKILTSILITTKKNS